MAPNVLVIVVDALRADRVYRENGLTPAIDDHLDGAERFTSCYACAEKTTASLTTIQTGLYPTRHGVLHLGRDVTEREERLMAGTPTIQELLGESHTSVGVNTRGRWLGRGYDRDGTYEAPTSRKRQLVDRLPDPLAAALRWSYNRIVRVLDDDTGVRSMTMGSGWPEQRRARWSTDRLLELTDESQPWYGFIHYYDTHTGYNYDDVHLEAVQERTYPDGDLTMQELKQRYPGLTEVIDARLNYADVDTVGDLKRGYDAAVRTVDEEIGRLLERLDRRGDLDDTAVVLTSDHGECLTEHGVLFNHAELYEQSWRVPLLVDAPGFEGTEDGFVQHFDVLPTVLDLVDRSYRSERLDGVSLVPDAAGDRALTRDAVFAEQTHDARRRAIRTERYKFIRRLDGERNGHRSHLERPEQVLYDLRKDPDESENVAASHPERCRDLAARMERWIASLPEPETDVAAARSDADTEELHAKLEALGYKFD